MSLWLIFIEFTAIAVIALALGILLVYGIAFTMQTVWLVASVAVLTWLYMRTDRSMLKRYGMGIQLITTTLLCLLYIISITMLK